MPRPEPSKYVYCADEETNFAAVVKVDGDTLREVARHTGAPVGSCCRCGVDSSVAESDAGVQDIGSAVVDLTPGDDFELIARQTSGSTRYVSADELTWLPASCPASGPTTMGRMVPW
jgi:hypothetical protein